MADTLQKFMFEDASVRGELVDISEAWSQVQARRSYPPAVKIVLGEMLAAAALLSANLKFNGSIVMQIHGDGPVTLLVVECNTELRLRATAKLAAAETLIDDAATLPQLVDLHGQGRFVITLDPADKLPGRQAYQGIVPLDGESVATVIENYMLRSEQLDTKLWLAANDQVVRGMLLQKIPGQGGSGSINETDQETWERVVMLGSTLRNDEMLATDIGTLMHRLFWEETIRLFDPRYPAFHCSCTRGKVGNMLRMLGKTEIDSALADLGQLSINCDFCGQQYDFDKVDCAQLFIADSTATSLPAQSIKH
jgi:molecular chaperone Hsp33